MHILMTGATGFIGTQLVRNLTTQNHQLTIITGRPQEARLAFSGTHQYLNWTEFYSLPEDFVADVVIHLAGESVAAARWSTPQKEKLIESRVTLTSKIIAKLQTLKIHPQTFISASAVGIYGDRGNELLTEDSNKGEGFLADLTSRWESVLFTESNIPHTRKIALRFGLVFGRGGFLEKLIPMAPYGLVGKMGNGQQWQSWISIKDIVKIIDFLLVNKSIKGPINAVAPNPLTQSELASLICIIFGGRKGIPVPKWALKMALGEMSDLMLFSQKVSAQKITDAGFDFEFKSAVEALEAIELEYSKK